MIALTAAEAGEALGIGCLRAAVTGVSIDSRSLQPGDLFVAIRGQRFDGHDFVEAAFAAGASGAVVQREEWSRRGAGLAVQPMLGPVYEVADTVVALGQLARAVRRRSRARVFAITGSVGKTTTKDVLSAMLGQVLVTVATRSNQNNEIGVPLTLLSLAPDTEAVVVEMGMRGRGQIATLAGIAEPDVGIIVSVHPVHIELLGDLVEIAAAKAELIAGLKPEGVLIVPAGCSVLEPFVASSGRRVLRFAKEDGQGKADVVARVEHTAGSAKYRLRVSCPNSEVEVELASPPPPRFAENVGAAAAACYAAGLPLAACMAGVPRCLLSERRWRVLRLAQVVIVDDTYNANPVATKAAIDALVAFAKEEEGRPLAVLGDMLELGEEAAAYHREVGEYAAASGIKELWAVGSLSAHMVEGFRERASRGEGETKQIAGHLTPGAESPQILARLHPRDVVLFKASRSMGLDKLVDEVVAALGAGEELVLSGKQTEAKGQEVNLQRSEHMPAGSAEE